MGWFYNDTRIFVHSASAKLLDETSNAIGAAVVYATTLDRGVAENIVAASISRIANKARSYTKYGKNLYTHGLPSAGYGLKRVASEFGDPSELPVTPLASEMLPIAEIRRNTEFINKDSHPDEYTHLRRMLKKVAVKQRDIISVLEEDTEGNPNPDLANLDDAFFLFSTDLYSTVVETVEYQFKFFTYLGGLASYDKADYDALIASINAGDFLPYIDVNTFTIESNEFKVELTYDYIEIFTQSGTLTDGAEYEKDFYIRERQQYNVELEDGAKGLYNVEMSELLLKEQTSPGQITIIRIKGIYHFTTVNALGTAKEIERVLEAAYIGLDPEVDTAHGTSGLHLPVNVLILEELRKSHRDIVLYDSMMLVLNSAEKVQLEWYQTSIFRAIFTMIAVYFAVASFGGSTTITAALFDLFLTYATSLVLNFLLELILSNIDSELALILAVALSIAVTRGTSNLLAQGTIPLATQVLDVTNALQKVAAKDLELKTDDLTDSRKELEEFIDSEQDKLREAASLLPDTNDEYDFIWVENARQEVMGGANYDDYYANTLSSAEVNDVSIEAVGSSIDRMLELPVDIIDFKQTLAA